MAARPKSFPFRSRASSKRASSGAIDPMTVRTSLKFHEEQIRGRLKPLLDAASPNLVYLGEPDLSWLPDRSEAIELRAETILLGSTVNAFLQLYAVYDNAIVTFKMSRRFPWRQDEIEKSRHLALVWFQFISQCYLFKENAKLFANYYNRAVKVFHRDDETIDIASLLKRIEKNLGRQIHARGSSMRKWYVEHESVEHLEAIDVVDATERVDSPLGDIGEHYDDAKALLGAEIQEAITFMEQCLLGMLDANIGVLIEIVGVFDSAVATLKMKAKASGATR
ncbi:MAG TPA: hypothetical protein VG271_12430 [Beijerinckiaceae bacterium]|nr:hypothetical protein [Beijerinckiaceae bacterium]